MKMSALKKFCNDMRAAEGRGIRFTGEDILEAIEYELKHVPLGDQDKPFPWDAVHERAVANARKRYHNMVGVRTK